MGTHRQIGSREAIRGWVMKVLEGCDFSLGKEDPPENIGALSLMLFRVRGAKKGEKSRVHACVGRRVVKLPLHDLFVISLCDF